MADPDNIKRRTVLIGAATAVAGLSGGGVLAAPRQRLIATEEGFALPETLAATRRYISANPLEEGGVRALSEGFGTAQARQWFSEMVDFGAVRLGAMDAAGIDTALLLHGAPGVQIFGADEATGLAALVNDRIVEISRSLPRRYAPLATIAPQDPKRAAVELERAVRQLGMHGALINSHTKGEYLDDPKFWPIFEAAQALDVPIYIHPREPSRQMLAPYQPHALMGPIWGFGAETGLHALRIIMAGVFDQFPRLQIVLGHCGEGLPFFIDRIDMRYKVDGSPMRKVLKRRPSDYLRNNFHLTTSGMNWEPAIRQTLEVMGPDRVQFAADWPFEDATDAAARFANMAFDGAVRAKLSHANAERVWRIAA